MPFGDALSEAVADIGPPGASGGEKKNYTEKISAALTTLVGARLRELGLREARAPQRGRDKQFMGGYGRGRRRLRLRREARVAPFVGDQGHPL